MRILALTFCLLACDGDSKDAGDGEPCDCAANQVCVVHFTVDTERYQCAAAPTPCTGQTGDCLNDACVREGYGLCDDGFIGVGCSDTVAPPVFSCNQ